MDISVTAFPEGMSIINTIISLAILGVGIYIVFLIIKALRAYIKKNS
ncbi:hypothetical protein [Tissierella creatinophila]|uniref:Uncharacterized protein n=1 Tax=Tissierella creatinophila DSM 6911 TaxID=1123403 RepID=A0A1U7M425_TISCR|nr:hypothetical protein [Tissierella creatinophila]OLS02067.1 hypothetical protein TICRE_18850 [Tissierella creatinophila DSM 6911]